MSTVLVLGAGLTYCSSTQYGRHPLNVESTVFCSPPLPDPSPTDSSGEEQLRRRRRGLLRMYYGVENEKSKVHLLLNGTWNELHACMPTYM